MRRRDLVALFAGATVWPRSASAQDMPAIGFLSSRAPEESARLVRAFVRGLLESGFREGRHVRITYRWAGGRLDELRALATELVREPVAILVTAGGSGSAFAAKSATTSIPIVFVIGGDPVNLGLVASLPRPGGNATGVTMLSVHLTPKRLDMLRELVPNAASFAVITNLNTLEGGLQAADAIAAAERLGVRLAVFSAPDERGIEAAFASVSEQRVEAVLLAGVPLFDIHREKIINLAAALPCPVIYPFRDFADAGGVMSYGPDLADAYRQAGYYAGQILRGVRPADLPVVQATKFELVINLKTAKAMGLAVPLTLQAQADEVIE
jgi:putative tryptophan/tyrosine transport system substrate-binding protein